MHFVWSLCDGKVGKALLERRIQANYWVTSLLTGNAVLWFAETNSGQIELHSSKHELYKPARLFEVCIRYQQQQQQQQH